MRFASPLVLGKLLRRYQRFLADVLLQGGDGVVAHVPNTGSMMSTREPGCAVALSRSSNPKRKLAYTLELVRATGGAWVGVNTALTNHVAAEAMEQGRIPELSGYERLRREVRMGERSRVDFLLEGSSGQSCFVEVKNVTYRRGEWALFPDAVTERGARHLEELRRIVDSGGRAAMLFVVNRDDCQVFGPAADIDPRYAALLAEVARCGVEVLAYAVDVSLEGLSLYRPLRVQLEK